jgi:hypothetical protein
MRKRGLWRVLYLLALLGTVPLVVGCGSGGKRAGHKVTGKVTHNGKPVSGAKVIFTDGKDGGPTANGPTAITDESGEYALVGVPPGSYKVVVYKFTPKPGAKMPADTEGMDMEQLEASGMGVHALPAKYSRPGTTTLVAQDESGENTVDLKLTG